MFNNYVKKRWVESGHAENLGKNTIFNFKFKRGHVTTKGYGAKPGEKVVQELGNMLIINNYSLGTK